MQNQFKKANAQKCATKIISTQNLNLTVPGLCKTLQSCQLKGKIYITKQLQAQVPHIKRNGSRETKALFVKAVNYLLDQHKHSKGKSISVDFRDSIRQFIVEAYHVLQTDLVENLPSTSMTTLFELI